MRGSLNLNKCWMKISFIYALILSTYFIFLYLDFDECKDERFNSCHEYAYCTNIDGSYICNCFEGFFGDGKKCQGMLLLFCCTRSSSKH